MGALVYQSLSPGHRFGQLLPQRAELVAFWDPFSSTTD
jgi:hypothetical protein